MLSFLFLFSTLGLEYVWNILLRIYMIYDRKGRFGRRVTLRSEFYKAMINSCMICWMDVDSGHLEFRNLRMPYVQAVQYCRIELDHEVKI